MLQLYKNFSSYLTDDYQHSPKINKKVVIVIIISIVIFILSSSVYHFHHFTLRPSLYCVLSTKRIKFMTRKKFKCELNTAEIGSIKPNTNYGIKFA